MRIVIDMQGAQTESRFRGIGRYTLSFAQAIVRNRGEHKVSLALSGLFPDTIEPIRAAFDGLLPQENIRVWHAPGPVSEGEPGNEWRREVAELIREAFLASLQPDVIHISSLFEGYVDDAVTSIGRFDRTTPVSVTVHDLIPLLNQDHYLKPNPRYAQYYQRKVEHLKNAAVYLAVSESSRQEALAHLVVPEGCIVNTSEGIDECFQPRRIDDDVAAQLRQKFGLTRPFVLYTGGADERKNLPRLIQAFSALPAPLRMGHQLLLAGKMPEQNIAEFNRQAKSAGLKPDELCFTGYVTDEELIQLYNLCKLFVFPSWHEGFGLPALEAMACGAPVIGANGTSIPEVIGLAEALFDPLSPQSIMEKMAHVLRDESFRQQLRLHGLNQARKFSWDECAKRALCALENKWGHNKWGQTRLKKPGKPDSILIESDPIYSPIVRAIAAIREAGVPSDADLVRVADCIAFNLGRETPKQLMVDISDLVQRDAKSGIQRVIRGILRELLENPPPNTDVRPIYFDGARYRHANVFAASFFTGATFCDATDEIVDFCQDDIYLALDLNIYLTTSVHDLHLRLRSHGVQLYFIVYDILLLRRPDWWPQGINVAFEAWLRSISEVATGLICISEAVAEEVRSWLMNNPPARIAGPTVGSFHLGADIENSVPTEGMPDKAAAVLERMRATSSFLMVGTVEPRKGHAQTLAAFELLWQQGLDINLVIVGRHGWLVDQLTAKLRRHPELNRRLFWLEGISDEYLQQVYATSTCLIAPSEGEGFGLPLIEAAQYQLPIMARDLPVFREVAGEHAFYFSGLDAPALTDALDKWLALNANGLAPQSAGMPWLTWQESTRQLIERIYYPPTTRKYL